MLLLLAFGIISPALPEASASEPPALPSPYVGDTLPNVHISIAMENIDYSDWRGVSVSVDNTLGEYQFSNAQAEIRGRGNSTWSLDKKPFRIRFKKARSMLDSGHASFTWTFLADHSDKSLMRNYGAYRLASQLNGMSAAPFGRHVNVYLGGVYQGVYLLSIQVSEIAAGRVELAYHRNPARCEYLIEMDDRIPDSGVEGVNYVTVGENHYAISYPSGKALTASHVQYVRNYLTSVDNAIAARDRAVYSLIDIPSFVDYYIVQELYKNVDIGFSSVFMQIKGNEASRRLEMGPVWDFDISAGNARTVNYSPTGPWAATQNTWYRGLAGMPYFTNALVNRWNVVKNAQVRDTIDNIRYMGRTYHDSYQQNFSQRWNIFNTVILYNPPEVMARKSFSGQVDYLTGFLESRRTWMDGYINANRPSLQQVLADGATGWVNWSNNWYYFGSDGAMTTGWFDYGDNWYYFNTGGTMATGWLSIDGGRYYFDENGVMATGWLLYNGTWYYLHPNGIIAANTTLVIDGAEYSFDESGGLVTA